MNGGDQLMVRYGTPTIGGARCVDGADFIEVHMGGSAVKGEIGAASRWEDDEGRGFELCNHDDEFPFWVVPKTRRAGAS